MILMMGIFSMNSSAQHDTDRQAYAAGKFYSDNPASLKDQLISLFGKAAEPVKKQPRAIIVPHAGYVYSGEVAASGFKQLSPDARFENIFILTSSHRETYKGASVYHKGDYITPLGRVEVNQELAEKLVKNESIFQFRPEAHNYEHSLEVQLPFLQYHLKKNFRIVPIVVGAQNLEDCREIADALKPYFNDKNLFVISTDFSHYPSYTDAKRIDKKTADAILQNSANELEKVLAENKREGVSNLATSLCGWSAVFSLLYMSAEEDMDFQAIRYMNSGDQPFGDKNQVVGYYSIAVFEKDEEARGFQLDKEDEKQLLQLARKTIDQYLMDGSIPRVDPDQLPGKLNMHLGAFVTLTKEGELRGCVGRFQPDEPLYSVVQQMAIAAATHDSRFSPVDAREMEDIEIEISVLTPMKKIASIDEIELGRHGIYIKKGNASGTFLPQVADKTGWTSEEFLGHCARDKAGIGWDGWKNAEIYTYEAIVFEENEIH
ncbi:MAG: AmmeMemoRadiSam system protein B [Bacteroidota bacterium]|nr:AmmeMemoRadiSam system protein B [Bacteroidota bacterium]